MEKSSILQKPIITETSLRDAQKGIFTFKVNLDAKRREIKKTIEKMFNVHVNSLTSLILKGKKRAVGRKRMQKSLPDTKKVRVRLLPGEKIDLFEVGEKK